MLRQRRSAALHNSQDPRSLADDLAEQERAAIAAKAWLLARIEKKRPSPSADIADMAPDEPFSFERLTA